MRTLDQFNFEIIINYAAIGVTIRPDNGLSVTLGLCREGLRV